MKTATGGKCKAIFVLWSHLKNRNQKSWMITSGPQVLQSLNLALQAPVNLTIHGSMCRPRITTMQACNIQCWLIDWLLDCVLACLLAWLIDWLIDWVRQTAVSFDFCGDPLKICLPRSQWICLPGLWPAFFKLETLLSWTLQQTPTSFAGVKMSAVVSMG